MSPETLAQVLRPLENLFSPNDHPQLLVGLEKSDDAAVYQISDQVAIIHTLDFFTPVVDDPYDYGAIAAANALSDVYAMGGEVLLALNICGFPKTLAPDLIADILRGGADKVAEAGGVLAGGHTITDPEPKYGLSVLGTVHPRRILKKSGARPGDLLVLTKPLGVGIITTALKGDVAAVEHVAAAVASMKKLNQNAARIAQQIGVHAATDITGFSLLGHGYEMAEKSTVGLRIYFSHLPFLAGAQQYAEQWLFPGGACNNQKCYQAMVKFSADISEEMQMLMFTPETSGGLLLAVPSETIDLLQTLFAEQNHPCWHIGEVVAGQGVEIVD